MRPLLNALAFCGLLLLVPGVAHAQPGAADDSASLAQIMFARINEARVDSGLPPYRENATLTRIAFEHAREIAAHNHYSHTSLDGRRAKDRALAAGYGAGHAGVRIGENFVGRQHLDDGFQWLMEDPPHRANMLHPEYREAGAGAARMSYGYVWVIDFGTYQGIDAVLAAGDRGQDEAVAATPTAPATPTAAATTAPPATSTTAATTAPPTTTAPPATAVLPTEEPSPVVVSVSPTLAATAPAPATQEAAASSLRATLDPAAASPTTPPPAAPPSGGPGNGLVLGLVAAALLLALLVWWARRR